MQSRLEGKKSCLYTHPYDLHFFPAALLPLFFITSCCRTSTQSFFQDNPPQPLLILNSGLLPHTLYCAKPPRRRKKGCLYTHPYDLHFFPTALLPLFFITSCCRTSTQSFFEDNPPQPPLILNNSLLPRTPYCAKPFSMGKKAASKPASKPSQPASQPPSQPASQQASQPASKQASRQPAASQPASRPAHHHPAQEAQGGIEPRTFNIMRLTPYPLGHTDSCHLGSIAKYIQNRSWFYFFLPFGLLFPFGPRRAQRGPKGNKRPKGKEK